MARFFSLSTHPGRTGTWFYSRFFQKHGLNHSYHAIGSSNLADSLGSLRRVSDLGGISISMPFKKIVIPLLDAADQLATSHGMCNTIIPVGDQLIGYNCDHAGAEHLVSLINSGEKMSILGNGAIGSMIQQVMSSFSPLVFSRSIGNWDDRHSPWDVIINATGVGTSTPGSPIRYLDKNVRLVIDLSMAPGTLRDQCTNNGIEYAGGLVFYRYQFMKQYKLYTGITINDKDINDAINEYEQTVA